MDFKWFTECNRLSQVNVRSMTFTDYGTCSGWPHWLFIIIVEIFSAGKWKLLYKLRLVYIALNCSHEHWNCCIEYWNCCLEYLNGYLEHWNGCHRTLKWLSRTFKWLSRTSKWLSRTLKLLPRTVLGCLRPNVRSHN